MQELPLRLLRLHQTPPPLRCCNAATCDMAALNNPGEVLSSPPSDGVSALTFSDDSDLLLVSSWDSVGPQLHPPSSLAPSREIAEPFVFLQALPGCGLSLLVSPLPTSTASTT